MTYALTFMTASIVTYRTPPEELRECLASLSSTEVERIYVVDNSSLPELAEVCREDSRVIYIPNKNTGYGSGHNMAIKMAMESGSAFHLVLNSDVEFVPSVIDNILAYMRQNPEVGIVQPRITYPSGRPQYTCRLLPTPANVFFRRFLPPVGRLLDKRYLISDYDGSYPLSVPSLQGSFLLMRMQALRDCGLFDERYFMYCEDIDLTRRIHTRYRTVYFPQESIRHVHRAASYHSLKMLFIHMVNMTRYFNKWGWFSDPERGQVNAAVMREVKSHIAADHPE